jgi:hypothetical protein
METKELLEIGFLTPVLAGRTLVSGLPFFVPTEKNPAA